MLEILQWGVNVWSVKVLYVPRWLTYFLLWGMSSSSYQCSPVGYLSGLICKEFVCFVHQTVKFG